LTKKVAILGGGPAALAAAFDLAEDPDNEVTVYTAGWRLGGKCASGRNFDVSERNEEHGLHLPMGFYENFFDQMHTAYTELGRHSEIDAAFVARSTLVLQERFGSGWRDWPFTFPDHGGVPGTRARRTRSGQAPVTMSLAEAAQKILSWLQRHTLQAPVGLLTPELKLLARALDAVIAPLPPVPPIPLPDIPGLLDLPLAAYRSFLENSVWPLVNADLANGPFRRFWILAELAFSMGTGLLKATFAHRSLLDLDQHEFTDWLDRHAPLGALRPFTRDSAPLRMVYELVFAFEQGDATKPSIGAGVAIRGLTRLAFDYEGAVAYDLRSGMGETVIVPYYQAILRRNANVRFEFFSRVTNLVLSADAKTVDTVVIDVQATTVGGIPYDPLRSSRGELVWPSKPKYELLVQGGDLRGSNELPGGGFDLESSFSAWKPVDQRKLERGRDFDEIVLAIPAPALVAISGELAAAKPEWQRMLRNVTGVPTAAMQLWLSLNSDELGFGPARAESGEEPLIGAFADNLGTIADMTRILRLENWTPAQQPQACAYFCGPFVPASLPPTAENPNPDYLADSRQQVQAEAQAWVEAHMAHIYPALVAGNQIDFTVLVDPSQQEGLGRFQSQYFGANVGDSDLYVTSTPGTTKHRLAPEGSLFANLFLAGDWTRNGMNAGALEAAVTSGRMAARGVMRKGYKLHGEGDGLV
jgi:uncharacterized protein with NAD-binding domain and iron-sulfur cluster